MAFSDAERADIRRYLGYSARHHDVDTELEHAMSAVNGTEDEATARAELERCKALDAKLNALDVTTADVTQVGAIKVRPAVQLSLIRSHGRQAASRLAAIMGVQKRSDAFSTGGPRPLGNYLL